MVVRGRCHDQVRRAIDAPGRRRGPGVVVGAALLLSGSCARLAGIDEGQCKPACVDETTRLVCVGAEAHAEPCPGSTEECARAACHAGECTLEARVGEPCGPLADAGQGGPSARCNEGFACLGPKTKLTAIRQHTCLVADDGKVWCWGLGPFGELGDGARDDRGFPFPVLGLPRPAVDASAGYAHTCAVLDDGSVYCWGNDEGGQCGSGRAGEPQLEPIRVPLPATDEDGEVRARRVVAGQGHTCALTDHGTAYCWGDSRVGQCGTDTSHAENYAVLPIKVPGLDHVTSLETVKDHTCALRSAAPTMMCWGSNSYFYSPEDGSAPVALAVGKLGPQAEGLVFSANPVPVDLGIDIRDIGMSFESTYAVLLDGTVRAWGFNGYKQLGCNVDAGIVTAPCAVMTTYAGVMGPLRDAADVLRTDGSDQCVELETRRAGGGHFLCWGRNDRGELGLGTTDALSQEFDTATRATALPDSGRDLVRGEDHGCLVVPLSDRTEVWCFGSWTRVANGLTVSDLRSEKDLPSQVEALPVKWDPRIFTSVFSQRRL